jgi:exonuclease III
MAVKLWKVLCWNIRGINSEKKWNDIRDRVVETSCDIICLQETKRASFDSNFLRQFCPPFDSFEFNPSNGASGGSIVIWKSAIFHGHCIFKNEFASSIFLSSVHNNSSWILTNIYAPCTTPGKSNFIRWFKNIVMHSCLTQ